MLLMSMYTVLLYFVKKVVQKVDKRHLYNNKNGHK